MTYNHIFPFHKLIPYKLLWINSNIFHYNSNIFHHDSIYSIYIVNLKENDIQTLHALIQYIPYILLISCIDSIYSIHIVNLKEDAYCQPQRGHILSTSKRIHIKKR